MELDKYISNTGKPLPVFLLLDSSGSMSGNKIETLNAAVKEMVDDFKSERLSEVDIKICVITFGDTAKVHTPLSSIKDFNYDDLTAGGSTPLGGALTICSEIINDKEQVPSKGYRPVVVLVSDGYPNDSWEGPLQKFLTDKRTSKCDKWALGIGESAGYDMLKQFINDDNKKVFDASGAKEISKFFKFVTLSTISRSKSVNPNEVIDRDALEAAFDAENPNFDFKL